MKSFLSLQGVGLDYGSRTILKSVDLELIPARRLSLVGPSGCGKSTLLRLLAGLEQPSRGKLERRPDLKVGMVFQDSRLLAWRTVEENILLPFEIRRKPAPDVTPLLEKLGLLEARTLFPHELSGGMKMRVAIGRALLDDPDLLLMDEPFAALDEVTRTDLQDWLLGLWQEKKPALVFVTHSLTESVYMGDRVLLMGRHGGEFRRDYVVPLTTRGAQTRFDSLYLHSVQELSKELHAVQRELVR